MSFAAMQVGRLTLAERPGGELEDTPDTCGWEGQESSPPLPPEQVARRHDDLLGLARSLVPVVFAEKTDRSGYYQVSDAAVKLRNAGGEVVTADWQIRAQRLGSDSEVDLESQLSGSLTRVNAHGLTGERWHAPPAGHYAYGLSTGAPSTLTVTGAEGPLTIYRDVPVGVNPRWGCALGDYGRYRVRFLDETGRERTGWPPRLPPTGWELHNSLCRVRVTTAGQLRVASPDGSRWEEKSWALTVASLPLGAPSAATVIRNEYEAVTVRVLWARNPGRTQLDLTLRRGARWVEGHLQTQPGGVSLTLGLAPPEATTSATGHITATGNDAAGNRFVAAAAGAFTPNTGASSITATSTASMHLMIGSVVGGGAAPTGDQAVNHVARWLGSTAELVRCVRR